MRVTDDKALHQGAVTGQEMQSHAADLFPLNHSITGPGVRQTLRDFCNIVPESLSRHGLARQARLFKKKHIKWPFTTRHIKIL